MAAQIESFTLPGYHEIPDVGLYLEQVVKFINTALEPLGCIEITSSMVSNYVKHSYIERPVKKQYGREQIAYLIFIALIKNVLSMDNISVLFVMQKRGYSLERAYSYFCRELENELKSVFGQQSRTAETPVSELPPEQQMVRSAVIAAAHMIYLSDRFERMKNMA